ncbi:MAG: hypothetical protein ACTS4U_00980 [Candidatus Hodgkinia cicadicola]
MESCWILRGVLKRFCLEFMVKCSSLYCLGLFIKLKSLERKFRKFWRKREWNLT